MKKLFLLSAAIILSGCASSERAFRMSGGVLDTYSAPKSFRTRSDKFRKIEQNSIPKRANKPEVSGINETLINIWPFYFRNQNYFSILWPMIDWDPYGMAFRPFYNQEGDDYSILFPLSSWNPVSKDGWVANVRWTKRGFGFIPLSWQQRNKDDFWCYYTPFFIINREYHKLGFDYKREYLRSWSSDFTEFFLGYYGINRHLDEKEWDSLYSNYKPLENDYFKYQVWKSGRPMPKNHQELTALRKEMEKTLTQYESTYGGFFPLFHLRRTPYKNSYSWNILGLLADVEKSNNDIDVSVFAKWFVSYKYNEYKLFDAVIKGTKNKSDLFMLPLLSGKEETTHINDDDKTVFKLRNLKSAVNGNFAQQLPKVNAALKALDPKAQVPEFINNGTLLRLYIDDYIEEYIKDKKFEFYTTGQAGIIPLFFRTWKKDSSSWFIFALLTGGEKKDNGNWSWISLPLLSGAGHSKYNDYLNILYPFGCISETDRDDKSGKYINASNAKWPHTQNDNIESTDIYAACGLFYRGEVKFLVAKPGLDHKTLNNLYRNFDHLYWRKKSLDNQEKEYKKDLKLANAVKSRNKIEYYEKMIALERLKIRRKSIDKDWKKFKKILSETETIAKKVNFKFDVSNWANKKQLNAVRTAFYDQTTLVREKSDIGNGLFFRKENYHNGDWKWHLFLNIAGGEKDGSKESFHILHFLYRNRTDGDRIEKLIFPFISIQKDGKNSKTSFLGRIYQKSVINGKSSGYIFFIPFGK